VSQTSWLSLRPGWLSKGSCQRRIMPQTARSFGQPRRISRRAALAGCIGLRFDLGTAVASLNKGEAGGRVRVMLADGSELAPRLVLACDGLDSRVRNTLRQWSGDGASFDPVVLPSASSGLNYKMLLVPPSFEMRNLSTAAPANALIRNEPQSKSMWLSLQPAGSPEVAFSARPSRGLPRASASFGQPRPISRLDRAGRPRRPVFDTGTEPQSAYVVPSAKTARRETIRLGLLPSRDPNVPRTANIIKPKDHSIWKVSEVSK
jgi:2-polyprenyl-6-methoxyphenol hydroxylase-like FAD-dependent oxidoreductase